jgi:beta-N-acetylhexosaminidase
MQNAGVLACGKHFPGHGDTDKDSHRELPVLRQDLDELLSREIKPFMAAIKARIPMMMTGHILLPNIDAEEPVTLSRRFNQQLLRDRLGFTGVTVSDDIGMHAVSTLFEDPAAMVKFINAGADMLMVCAFLTDTDRCRGLARALMRARSHDSALAERMQKSHERIQRLLESAPQNAVSALPAARFAEHQTAGALFGAATVEVI